MKTFSPELSENIKTVSCKILAHIEKLEKSDISDQALENILIDINVQINILKGAAILFDLYDIADIFVKVGVITSKITKDKSCIDDKVHFLKVFFINLCFMDLNENYGKNIFSLYNFLLKNPGHLKNNIDGKRAIDLLYIFLKLKKFRNKLDKSCGEKEIPEWNDFFNSVDLNTFAEIGNLQDYLCEIQSKIYTDYQKKINIEFNTDREHVFVYSKKFQKITDWINELVKNSITHSYKENMKIFIEVGVKNQKFIINYTDDGKGFDLEKYSLEEIPGIIFKKGFTTVSEKNVLSGQGLGLYNIKDEITDYGGQIYLNHIKDNFFQFVLEIPDTAVIWW
ncbi:MAG: ATP-binding protein [Candidatus Muiribacteriota bacterium]